MSLSFIFLSVLGLVVGFFSGLLGIGGGLLMIAALLYLPHVLSLPAAYSLKQITGIAVVQSLAGSLSSVWIHYKQKNLLLDQVGTLGVFSMAGSYVGGYTSQFFPDSWIKMLLIAVLVTTLMLSWWSPQVQPSSPVPESLDQGARIQKRIIFSLFALLVGYVSGVLGIGGAVFLVPVLYGVLGVPVHLAIGTGAGIVLLTALFGFLGKWQSAQIPLPDVLYIVIGAFLGAILGARLTRKTPIPVLKGLFFAIILMSLIRTLSELL